MATSNGARPSVVITGSTRGIGRALAHELVTLGARVVVNGREDASVRTAIAELEAAHGAGFAVGHGSDLRARRGAQSLWDAAVAAFGRVDIWINNAGLCSAQVPFASQTAGDIEDVVTANLLGTMWGSHVALHGMRAQGNGALYNMEGMGADGTRWLGMAVYGAAKRGIRYFTRSLVDETRGTGLVVGTLSPGILPTEGLLHAYRAGSRENWRRAQPLFNRFGDEMSTVIPWLARRVLTNRRHGASIAWMTLPAALLRMLDPRRFRPKQLFPADIHVDRLAQ